jgi:hypothetical protein
MTRKVSSVPQLEIFTTISVPQPSHENISVSHGELTRVVLMAILSGRIQSFKFPIKKAEGANELQISSLLMDRGHHAHFKLNGHRRESLRREMRGYHENPSLAQSRISSSISR